MQRMKKSSEMKNELVPRTTKKNERVVVAADIDS